MVGVLRGEGRGEVTQPLFQGVAPDGVCTLTLITVHLNDLSGLSRTLESVVAQVKLDPADWEVVVVDGRSAELTEVVSSVRFLDESGITVRLYSEFDDGVYDAMNFGASVARGRYLWYLNAGDSLASPSSVNDVLSTILEYSPNWIVGGALHERGGHGASFVIENRPHIWYRHTLGIQQHCHQATIVSAALFTVLGGFRTDSFAGDFDFLLRAGLVSRPIELSETIATYAGGGLSARKTVEVPRALADIRAQRFQLGPLGLAINRVWACLHEAHIRAHRLRRS